MFVRALCCDGQDSALPYSRFTRGPTTRNSLQFECYTLIRPWVRRSSSGLTPFSPGWERWTGKNRHVFCPARRVKASSPRRILKEFQGESPSLKEEGGCNRYARDNDHVHHAAKGSAGATRGTRAAHIFIMQARNNTEKSFRSLALAASAALMTACR